MPLQSVIGVLSDAKKSTGTLDSACKMVTYGWKSIEVGFGVSSPVMTNLSKQFAGFSGLVSALNVLDRAYEWVSSKKRAEWGWQKYVGQSALTVSHTLEFTSFLNRTGVVNLGTFGSEVAPGVVPLDIVKYCFYIPASTFGIWHSTIVMGKQDKIIDDLNGKVTKWTDRKQEDLNQFIPAKLAKIGQEQAALSNKWVGKTIEGEDAKRVEKLEHRHHRFTAYQDEWNDHGTRTAFEADCDTKRVGYESCLPIAEANSGKVKTREWLNLAQFVGKLVMGIIGLIGTFFGLFVSALFTASFAAGWFVTHTLNFAKGVYEQDIRNKPRDLPIPHFV